MTDMTTDNKNEHEGGEAGGAVPAAGAGVAEAAPSSPRAEQFRADIAQMKLKDPATGRDSLLLVLGVIGMVAGVGLAVAALFLGMDASGPLQQRDAIVQALLGLTVATVGTGLFVKASLTTFLRFWLARLCFEQQASSPD